MMDEDEFAVDGEPGIQPLEIAKLELTLRIMPDGRKAMGFLATTPENEIPALFDLHGMIGFAHATITDREWLAEAYEFDEED